MDIVAIVVTVADAVVVANDEVVVDDPLDTVVAVGGTDASFCISVKSSIELAALGMLWTEGALISSGKSSRL